MRPEALTRIALPSHRTTSLFVACLVAVAATVAVGGAAAVPDARLTVDAVGATPADPVVGERTQVNVTVANSPGSPDAAEVTEVRLLDADGDVRDTATTVGSVSPGDDLDARLWTRFDEPGERRLTVEVVAAEPADDDDADDDDRPTVRVERDLLVAVEPAATAVDLRARTLDPEDLRTDEEGGDVDVGGVGGVDGVEGILGGGDGGLDSNEDDGAVEPVESPVAVTVVNTGTVTADRVSVTAVGDPIAGTTTAGGNATAPGDGAPGDRATDDDATDSGVDAGPFVVEDVAPGAERQVVVDLGSLDRRSAVTFTARFRSSAGPPDGEVTTGTTETELAYPPREGGPTVTDASVTTTDDGRIAVEGNLGNTGDAEIGGVVVAVADAEGVTPTPAGGGYFVGAVGGSDFVPFDLETTGNASVADEVPIRIEYTDRGVRYVETVAIDVPDPEANGSGAATDAASDDGAPGFLGAIGGGGGIAVVSGVAGVLGLAAAGVVGIAVRRRDV